MFKNEAKGSVVTSMCCVLTRIIRGACTSVCGASGCVGVEESILLINKALRGVHPPRLLAWKWYSSDIIDGGVCVCVCGESGWRTGWRLVVLICWIYILYPFAPPCFITYACMCVRVKKTSEIINYTSVCKKKIIYIYIIILLLKL